MVPFTLLKKLETLEKVYLGFDWKKIAYFFDVVFPKSGLIDGNKVTDFVREYVHAEAIEHLSLPFKAVAIDITTEKEVAGMLSKQCEPVYQCLVFLLRCITSEQCCRYQINKMSDLWVSR